MEPETPLDGSQLITQISDFLARYLHCSEHQRTVIALWIVHTHCFPAARVTPYLHIRSRHKQSGKTLCLHLLSLLCNRPAPTTGFTAATLTHRINTLAVPTFLLDECQATFGSRSRSKNPVLRAILANGFERGFGYSDRIHERNIFSPKAFAGIGQLPEPLADRSIPVILESLPAKHKLQRFHPARAAGEAEPLFQNLQRWSEENSSRLNEAEAAPYTCADFPPGLSPRRQDIIEPLLHIADLLAGNWPSLSRQALMAIFDQEIREQDAVGIELLCILRRVFAHHGNPKRISTSVLLEWLHSEPNRPWNQEGLINAHGLAHLLVSFGIRPRTQRIGDSAPARGYVFQDFVPLWARLLPNSDHEPHDEKPQFGVGCNSVAPTQKAQSHATMVDISSGGFLTAGSSELDPYDPDDRIVVHMEGQGYRPFCPDDPGKPEVHVGPRPFIAFGRHHAGDCRFRARRVAKFLDPEPPTRAAFACGGAEDPPQSQERVPAPVAGVKG